MSKEQLIGMLSATSNLLDEREDIIEYIDSLQVGMALDEKEIKAGYQKFREQKNNQEINIIAKKHGIKLDTLMRANPNIDPYNLLIGTQLCIPQ